MAHSIYCCFAFFFGGGGKGGGERISILSTKTALKSWNVVVLICLILVIVI